jgi:hypothetical protein
MKKIILTSMIVVVSSLTVGCSNEEYIKEKDIINITSNTKKLVSKEVKLPIYFLDKNIRKVKYLSIDDNLSIEEKVKIISNTISAICFKVVFKGLFSWSAVFDCFHHFAHINEFITDDFIVFVKSEFCDVSFCHLKIS